MSPKKLYQSKWTAVTPKNKEKHFIVTEVITNEEEVVVACVIEAVMTRRQQTLPWRELGDSTNWKTGWC